MNPSEITIFEKELNEYIFMYEDNMLNSASVKAYINREGCPKKQYLKVTISAVYLVDAMIDFTIDDFKRLLFYKSDTVITDRIVSVLTKLTTGGNLLKDIRNNYGDQLTDDELEYQVNTDKVFLSEIKNNLLNR